MSHFQLYGRLHDTVSTIDQLLDQSPKKLSSQIPIVGFVSYHAPIEFPTHILFLVSPVLVRYQIAVKATHLYNGKEYSQANLGLHLVPSTSHPCSWSTTVGA